MRRVIKPTLWKGEPLTGTWIVTRKLDGVRLTRKELGEPLLSRLGNPLHNLPFIPDSVMDAEVFCGNWEATITATKTHDAELIHRDCIYTLDPLDPRLVIGLRVNPHPADITQLMEQRVAAGDEGLVLVKVEQGVHVKWLKVKPAETYDVYVTGYAEGKGRNAGLMGALLTDYGRVGTGFTDEHRRMFADLHAKGRLLDRRVLIEVECMGITKGNKFRHARFKRVRLDKSTESVPHV